MALGLCIVRHLRDVVLHDVPPPGRSNSHHLSVPDAGRLHLPRPDQRPLHPNGATGLSRRPHGRHPHRQTPLPFRSRRSHNGRRHRSRRPHKLDNNRDNNTKRHQPRLRCGSHRNTTPPRHSSRAHRRARRRRSPCQHPGHRHARPPAYVKSLLLLFPLCHLRSYFPPKTLSPHPKHDLTTNIPSQ